MQLYLKYRPNTLDEMYGNENIKQYWLNIKKEDVPHAIMFHGESGCGKTTLARIIANMLGCVGDDLREGAYRGIDAVREIRSKTQFKPLHGPCQVWIMDECHRMGRDALEDLLKILEDTPKHVYFILCTTEPKKVLPTILGRCDKHQVSPLNRKDMMKLLFSVVKKEGKTIGKPIYDQIIQDGMGKPRDSLQILNQIIDLPPEKQLEAAKKAAEDQSKIVELCQALLNKSAWKKVSRILSNLDHEPESIRRAVLGYCNSVMLRSDNPQAITIMEQFEEPTYNIGAPGITLACYRCLL
jgi:DNA polymerase-3 subunit gamma/tau